MLNRKNCTRFLTVLVVAVTATLALCQPAAAQRFNNQQPSHKISEEAMPWKGWPWLVGTLFAAGTLAVGFKNAKRTHLD